MKCLLECDNQNGLQVKAIIHGDVTAVLCYEPCHKAVLHLESG